MSFEQMLRDQLQREAHAVPLPERNPDQAVGRARTRRRHMMIGQVAAAGVVVAIAAAVVVPRTLDDSGGNTSIATPGESGLVPTGPLQLDWRPTQGGLSNVRTAFQGADGTVYALSTGPGARDEDHPDGDTPRAVYRLGDDGSWQPVVLDGDRPRAFDLASGDGLLYAVSTGPAATGDGTVIRLSTSGDGGDTWAAEDIEPTEPPSTAVTWEPTSSASVESNGSITLALVSTSYYPDVESLFPELESDDSLSVESRDEGLVLLRYDQTAREDVRGTEPTTYVEGDDLSSEDPSSDDPETPAGEVIRTVPWADLGVDGPEALNARTRLFQSTGGGWTQVDTGSDVLASLSSPDLQVAGDRFVATGWVPDDPTSAEGSSLVLTSTDGTSWSPVSVPGGGDVVSVGPALVQIPYESTVLQVSGDAGSTWSEVDLATAGVGEGAMLYAADGGPLGLALVAAYGDDRPAELVLSGDLIDWTVTPVSDVVGLESYGEITTVVGEDRIVVTATEPPGDAPIPGSVTAVGTPVRAG